MPEIKNVQKKPHNVIMKNCEKMSLSGVIDVESFDEKVVICYTDYGQLIIKGNALHVDNMDVSNGDMEITGQISAIVYTGEKKKAGIISKLFK